MKRGRHTMPPRVCPCGYETKHLGNFQRHVSGCETVKGSTTSTLLVENVLLKQKLADWEQKQADLMAQLAEAKQKNKELTMQLVDIARKPNTVNNIHIHVNAFGQESIDHITTQHIQILLSNPESAVPEFIRLKYKARENANIRVPNKKEPMYQVLVKSVDGQMQWERRNKQDVLEMLYDTNAGHLECEADEDTRAGRRFLDFQDKVKGNKHMQKAQLIAIHPVVLDIVSK